MPLVPPGALAFAVTLLAVYLLVRFGVGAPALAAVRRRGPAWLEWPVEVAVAGIAWGVAFLAALAVAGFAGLAAALGMLAIALGITGGNAGGALLVPVAAAAVVYLAGRGVAVPATTGALARRGYPAVVRRPVASVLHAATWLLAVTLGLSLAGARGVVVGVAVLVGAGLVVAGVGARGPLADAAAGAVLLREGQVRPGARVEWDGRRGRVEDVGLRVTTVDAEGTRLRVPNRELAGTTVAVEGDDGSDADGSDPPSRV